MTRNDYGDAILVCGPCSKREGTPTATPHTFVGGRQVTITVRRFDASAKGKVRAREEPCIETLYECTRCGAARRWGLEGRADWRGQAAAA
jgi:hypothetical protein